MGVAKSRNKIQNQKQNGKRKIFTIGIVANHDQNVQSGLPSDSAPWLETMNIHKKMVQFGRQTILK